MIGFRTDDAVYAQLHERCSLDKVTATIMPSFASGRNMDLTDAAPDPLHRFTAIGAVTVHRCPKAILP